MGPVMTPNARIGAAALILDRILAGEAAEAALLRWSRGARYAGSGDRAAVRDLVFDALRKRRSWAAWGGADTGRGLMLGRVRADGADPAGVFTGQGHDPAVLTAAEAAAGGAPDAAAARNLPDWLWPAWQAALGRDADAVAQAMAERAPVWLRVNPRKATVEAAQQALADEGITTASHEALPSALRVTGNERKVAASHAYRVGWVELQDLSPQLACAALPVGDGMRVLDLCAGGGGKALAVAARASVRLTAYDADMGRMRDLPARAARAGVRITTTADPRGPFDLIIADVPCSGSGTWRRTPDQRWRLTPEALAQLTATQGAILTRAASLTAPGGHLAYMTCSLLDAENGDRVAAFLARNPGWRETDRHRFTPLDASDGFFLSLLAPP